jgi:phosphatidylserine/phosphatidylglycerophosphate/cardiolipin synthase-like enzyme
MAKFLNTSGTNYHLEELIKAARDRLILISPFLKLNDRMKELLADKDRLKIDVRIVYGKSELAPAEIDWLKALTYVRTSFCKNLHAKCYLSESACIVTSLNLYEFSMVNNNEMGVLIDRLADVDLYRDAYEEAQRIIRISDEVRITLERVERKPEANASAAVVPKTATPQTPTTEAPASGPSQYEKITTAKIAAKLGMSTKAFQEHLVELGMLELREGGRYYLVEAQTWPGTRLRHLEDATNRVGSVALNDQRSGQ